MKNLENKLVLVTGASSGIGAETSKLFAQKGAIVLLVARNEKNLQQIAEEISLAGGKAMVYPCDVTDYEAVGDMAIRVKKEAGLPDIILNNAGSGVWKFIEETSNEEAIDMIKAPYLAAFFVTRAFIPEMLERNSGHIVNMTSYPGFMPMAGATAYIASRTAMVGFYRALKADFYHTKLKSTIVYFAKVESTYWENNPGSEERIPKAQVLIPIITPEQAAKKIVSGIAKGKSKIRAPYMMIFIDFLTYWTPFITRFIMDKTGYRRKQKN